MNELYAISKIKRNLGIPIKLLEIIPFMYYLKIEELN